MELLAQLGGWDERTNILLKDRVRNILLEKELQLTLKPAIDEPKRLEYPVSDRAITLGYKPNNSQLQQIGKRASKLYQEKHGCQPPKREQFVGGTTRMVNVYGHDDLELLDEAIALFMSQQSSVKKTMNKFVITITKSDRVDLESLPEITIYQTESGKYFSTDVETLISAISLLARYCAIALVNKKESIAASLRLTAKQIAVEILPISERIRRVK